MTTAGVPTALAAAPAVIAALEPPLTTDQLTERPATELVTLRLPVDTPSAASAVAPGVAGTATMPVSLISGGPEYGSFIGGAAAPGKICSVRKP